MRMRPLSLVGSLVLSLLATTVAEAGPRGKRAEPERGSPELRRQGDRVLVGGEAAELSKGDGAAAASSAWRHYYLVQLAADPLATYRGGVPGFAATSPQTLGTRKLEPQRPEVTAYRGYLARQQDDALAAISQSLGRAVTLLRRYDAAFNGFAIELTPEEADRVRRMPGVRGVFRNEIRELATDAGPTWIGAPGIWNGTATGGLPGTRGEGVIVGVIDSGINSDHPSFADVGGDAFDHTNPLGPGVFRGWCNPGFPILKTCNDKLIGMWSYPDSGNNPEDDDGHGSHTASTAAGNVVTATVNAPTTSLVRQISGVAPHANIIAYDACAGGCPSTALVASVNQAILDGVDVINYSITGGADPYSDAVSIAFLNATAAGVLVSAAAENDGPGAGSVGHNEPWVQTIAAATHNRVIINRLIGMTGGDTVPPADITGKGFTSGYGPAPIVYAGNFGNPLCPLGAFAPGTFSGQIVVCDRGGGIGRVDKSQSVLNGGAGGFVLANDAASGNALVGDAYPLPGVHITFTNGVTLKTWLASGSGHMGSIAGWSLDLNPANGDIMAAFSARGPSALPDLLKPDVTAPGVDVLAAVSNGPTPPEFNFLSGTSMATPHMTGAAALIRALRPSWTPLMVKSALMLTTVTAIRKEDGTTPATFFDMGAGRVDLTKAGIAGFVLDETYANFSAANPGAGGDLTTLNLASLADGSCFQTCSWERTLLSTVSASRTWTGTVSAPAGMVVSITSPNPFVLPGGSARLLRVSVDVSAAAKNQWHFASILWSDGAGNSPDLRMPIAVFVQGSTDALTLQKTVDAPVTAPGARLDYTIRVANRFPSTATYTVTDPIPANTTYIPGSATGGLTFNSGTNTLTGTTGPLAGLQPTVSAEASPFGFVPPGSLLGTFNLCGLTAQCDDTIINLTGVDFFYLGVRYSAMRLASNGYVQPGAPPIGAVLPNQNLPDPADPDLVISPFWADLDMNGTSASDPGGGFFYFGVFEDPSNGDPYLIIGWEDAQLFGNPSQNYSFQLWIKEGTDQMWFVYQELNGGLPTGPFGGLTVGVENANGTAGMSRFYRPEGSCAPTCGSDVGTPPAIGTDLKVNSLESSATFTFAVTVSPTVPPGTLIQNIVFASDGVRTFQAVANSLVSLPAVGILVTPTSGLTTTEAGGTAQFNISLLSAPTGTVTIALSSDDTTEGTVSPSSVTFDATNWNTPQPVTVTGVDDLLEDGDVVYHIVTAPAVSTDNRYSKLDPADVTVTNIDDESNEGRYFTVTPCRLLDTRVTGAPLPSNFAIELLMRGRCGITGAAKAVAINVTAVGATAVGSLTVYPFSAIVPGTNSVSFRGIQARAAMSVIGLDAAGRIGAKADIPGGGTVHLIIDVSGYFE